MKWQNLLKYAVVLGRGIKMQIQRVTRQVHVYYIGGANADTASGYHSLPVYLDRVFSDGNFKILRSVKDGSTDVALSLVGVSLERRLVLDRILELVVSHVHGNDFSANVNQRCDNKNSKQHFHRAHYVLRKPRWSRAILAPNP